MTKFKAGDKVRLVGEEVAGHYPEDTIATMVNHKEYEVPGVILPYVICKGWEVELIEEGTEEAKFEDVQVGDRVRLTAANGDVVEFTVTDKVIYTLGSATNNYYKGDWEKFEILTRAQKPLVPGLYENGRGDEFIVIQQNGRAFYTCHRGSWIEIEEETVRLHLEGVTDTWTRRIDL